MLRCNNGPALVGCRGQHLAECCRNFWLPGRWKRLEGSSLSLFEFLHGAPIGIRRIGPAGDLALAVFALPLLGATPVHAQTLPENIAIVDSVSDAYKPIGGRIGSFYLYPEGLVQTDVTSNVFASDSYRRADTVLTLRPALRIVSDSGTQRYVGYVYGSRTYHARFSDENVSEYGVRGSARLGAPTASHFEITGSAERLVDPRDSINNVAEARTPVHRRRYAAEGSYTQVFNRLALTGGVRATRVDYSDARDRGDAVIDQDYRDYSQAGADFEARYELPSGLFALGRASYDRFRYDFGPGDPGFDPAVNPDRDSHRVRVEAGVGADLMPRWYGYITAGYSERRFGSQPIPLKTAKGFSFRSALIWYLNPVTTFTLKADRDFAESASRTIAGYEVTGGSVRIDNSPMRGMLLSFEFGLRNYSPIGPAHTRTELAGAVELTYFLSRQYKLFARALQNSRTSGDPFVVYDRFQYSAGVKMTF